MTKDEMFKLAATVAAPLVIANTHGKNNIAAKEIVKQMYDYLWDEYLKIPTHPVK